MRGSFSRSKHPWTIWIVATSPAVRHAVSRRYAFKKKPVHIVFVTSTDSPRPRRIFWVLGTFGCCVDIEKDLRRGGGVVQARVVE